MPFLVPFIPAIIGGAAAVGTAALSANAANKASKNALSAQNTATQESLAAQQAALDRITSLNQPFINAGSSVLPALGNRIANGAPNFSSPSYARPLGYRGPAAQQAAPLPPGMGTVTMGGGRPGAPSAPGALSGTGPTGLGPTDLSSVGGPTGQVPLNYANTDYGPGGPAPGGAPQGAGATPAPGGGYGAYLAANPDLAAEWNRIQSSGGDPRFQNEGDYLQWHDQNYPQENRPSFADPSQPAVAQPPTTPQQQQDPNAPPPQPLDLGTASPVVADYTRPDQPTTPTYTTPTFGASPDAASYLNGANFTTSPGYAWRLQQGQRNLNANFGAKGLLQSGSALQGAIDYGQNTASNEYNNWFNQQQQLYADKANQFNADRSSGLNQFNTDRSTGLNQFNTDRNNLNNNFAEDRSYGTNLAVNNRDFANSQYNTQTQNMFQLAGVGANAAAAIGGANNNYAANASNLYQNQGNNAANAAYANGQTQAQLYGTIGSTVGNLFSSPSRYTGGTPIPLQTANMNPLSLAAGSQNPGASYNFQSPITY